LITPETVKVSSRDCALNVKAISSNGAITVQLWLTKTAQTPTGQSVFDTISWVGEGKKLN